MLIAASFSDTSKTTPVKKQRIQTDEDKSS